MDEQLNWLIENNHLSCVRTCVFHFLNSINYQVHLIEKETDYSSYLYELRKKGRVLVKRYGKQYGITLKKNPELYEAGYPWLMRLYWFLRAKITSTNNK